MSNTRFTVSWLESHRVDVSTLTRTDVVGIGHVMAEVDGLVARLLDPERAAAMGLEPPRGILLYGSPGLGKTLVARYLGASLGEGIPFYELTADELSPDRIRGTLRHLAAVHPRSVVYLDEVDNFAIDRDYAGHNPDTRQLLTATLAALDGLVETPGPVVVASSNRGPRTLDQALIRSGRLGFKVRFDAPDESERLELFRLFTRDIPTADGADWLTAAQLTRGKSPADIRQIVEDAAGLAFVDHRSTLTEADLLRAIGRDGRIEPEPAEPEGARHRAAVHESGHVAACVALRGPAWVYSVRIATLDGTTAFGDELIPMSQRPDDELRDALVVSVAGIAAEKAVLGEAAGGGRFDIGSATDIALARVDAGLTDEPAPLSLDPLGRNVAESIKERLGQSLTGQLAAARVRAVEIVDANLDAIGRFAVALEQAGQLTGEELRQAIEDAGFRPARIVD